MISLFTTKRFLNFKSLNDEKKRFKINEVSWSAIFFTESESFLLLSFLKLIIQAIGKEIEKEKEVEGERVEKNVGNQKKVESK